MPQLLGRKIFRQVFHLPLTGLKPNKQTNSIFECFGFHLTAFGSSFRSKEPVPYWLGWCQNNLTNSEKKKIITPLYLCVPAPKKDVSYETNLRDNLLTVNGSEETMNHSFDWLSLLPRLLFEEWHKCHEDVHVSPYFNYSFSFHAPSHMTECI